jgi:hypothetical protein
MYSVPVKCETHGGFGEMQGMLLFDGQRLLLQYQTSDSVFGVLRSTPRQVEFALDSLLDARYGAGWFWLAPNIQLRLSDFNALAQLPSADGGRLKLSVRWSDRSDARRLIEGLSSLLAERRYALINEQITRMTASHPLGEARVSGRVSVPPPPPRAESEH